MNFSNYLLHEKQKNNKNLINKKVNSKFKEKNGIVYTPKKIVNFMLDQIEYNGEQILNKHIIDNSCGQGAFLVEVVKRYIKAYKNKNLSLKGIKSHLEKYIHGIEISSFDHKKTIRNLNNLLYQKKINEIKWNIINGDSTKIIDFNKKMHYVVGNPPYVRIHNINKKTKNNFNLSKKGMTDLYIIFFEIGIKMLSSNAKMIYISPNSFFNSKAGSKLRNYLIENNLLNKVINLGHYNPFLKANTYTAISILDKNKTNKNVEFCCYNGNKIYKKTLYKNNEFFIEDIFYFNSLKDIEKFKKINNCKTKMVVVKNGLATNLDSFFINKKWEIIKDNHIRDVYKISNGKYSKIIFPYDEEGNLINFNNLSKIIKEKFWSKRKKLEKRDLRDNKWYGFARTQGIRDTFQNKICINSIIKNLDSIKLEQIKKGIPVYSGYYVLYGNEDTKNIINIIRNKNFVNYVKTLNKEKNGDHFYFSSKDLEKYLNYHLGK